MSLARTGTIDRTAIDARMLLARPLLLGVVAALPLLLSGGSVADASVTYVVDTVSDEGGLGFQSCTAAANDCSLRGAMTNANVSSGIDTIRFNIPAGGTQTITVGLSALPNITDPVTIDGTSQPQYAQTPIIGVVSSGRVAPPGDGLFVAAGGSGSTISGLRVAGFPDNGIELSGATDVTVANNFVGVDFSGTSDTGNTNTGVYLTGGGSHVISGNVISGSDAYDGIGIADSNNNSVGGNKIGTNVAGTAAIPNGAPGFITGQGVRIAGTSTGNTIGGTTAAERNIISGNAAVGVGISGAGGNTILGNYIGSDATGTQALGNVYQGVGIQAPGNRIGGLTAGERNLITGSENGIDISGTGNLVQGNYVGTDKTGTVSLENGIGINVRGSNNGVGGTAGTTAGGPCTGACNLVSGNIIGVRVYGTANQLQGNYVGSNASGTSALGNSDSGMYVSGSNNTMGGTSGTNPGGPCAGACNLISGNGSGIEIPNGSGNIVQGNFMGTDVTGLLDVGNARDGISIYGFCVVPECVGSENNVIGGVTPFARNLISGNGGIGVRIEDTPLVTTGNAVLGNFIGTNSAGTGALGNTLEGVLILNARNQAIGGSTGVTPRGPCTGACNLISGNGFEGVRILGFGHSGFGFCGCANNNRVQGNHIGTDLEGTRDLGNLGNGVSTRTIDGQIDISDASFNTIGGTASGEANLISGNNGNGVEIAGGSYNGVVGNFIGTNAAGTGNLLNGVSMDGVSLTTIGGATAAHRNVISGNARDGVQVTAGPELEIDLASSDLPKLIPDPGTAISLIGGAQSGVVTHVEVIVSATHPADSDLDIHLIAPNGQRVELSTDNGGDGDNYSFTWFADWASTSITAGTAPFSAAIYRPEGSLASLIGSRSEGTWALEVTDDQGVGGSAGAITYFSLKVFIQPGNQIQGNYIGTNGNATAAVPNGRHGVEIAGALGDSIGGAAPGTGNVISGNATAGVLISSSSWNTVQGNFVGTGANQLHPLGNGAMGVGIVGISNGNAVGGAGAGEGNVVVYNADHGLYLNGGTGNQIRRNSMHSNAALGINLLPNSGVNPNDLGDGDTGANNAQNFPVLIGAYYVGGFINIDGTLNSASDATYLLEFFQSDTCDASDHGEGRTFIGDTSVYVTDSLAETPFSFSLATPPLDGSFLTATATDPNGNTSEFSACIPAVEDADDDNDGYTDTDEALIATNPSDPCGNDGWASDLDSTGFSANELDISDIVSFIAPVRRLDSSPTVPPNVGYNPRWDLVPGPNPPFTNHINIVDMIALLSGPAGSPAYPPMFGGARAFGRDCPFPP